MSHPIRVRGLKQRKSSANSQALRVAPYTGAWIETLLLLMTMSIYLVASFMGV